MAVTLFIIAICTSVIGSICGIGGGVLIKPILDVSGIMSVSAVSFLSGCTVLAMAVISVAKGLRGGMQINKKAAPALALGAALGGVAGKLIFNAIKQGAGNESLVGLVQSVVLALVTIATFVYMLQCRRGKIRTLRLENPAVSALIGLILGLISAFLGIGGGPINLAVLSYFYSMDTKTAAANSLLIILLSQLASLIQTLATASVPEFNTLYLFAMVAGGVFGGFLGQTVNKKLDEKQVGRLFDLLLLAVTGVCLFNAVRFGLAL